MNPGSDWLSCLLSAGVGRTGTFMALDRLMQHLREHEYADILGMVSEMRSHRLSMVQTEVRAVGQRGHTPHEKTCSSGDRELLAAPHRYRHFCLVPNT